VFPPLLPLQHEELLSVVFFTELPFFFLPAVGSLFPFSKALSLIVFFSAFFRRNTHVAQCLAFYPLPFRSTMFAFFFFVLAFKRSLNHCVHDVGHKDPFFFQTKDGPLLSHLFDLHSAICSFFVHLIFVSWRSFRGRNLFFMFSHPLFSLFFVSCLKDSSLSGPHLCG